MRLVRNSIFTLLFIIVGFIVFMPKVELYYKAEQLLKKQGIVIDNEEIKSNPAALKILHPVVYFRGVDVARASVVELKPLLFVNRLKAENIELLNVAKNFLNISINSLVANHTIFKPYYIKLNIDGNFGVASGYIDLKSKIIHIDIVEPKDINSIKKFLKKGKKGWFYESKI